MRPLVNTNGRGCGACRRPTLARLVAILIFVCLPSGHGADSSGSIATLAGTGTAGYTGDNGPAARARLANHRIRKVDAKTGIITTFAGTGSKAVTPDGARITGTPLNGPRALDFDRAGN